MTRVLSFSLLAVAVCTAQDVPRPLGTEQGFALFQTRCMTCHGNPATPTATDPVVIRQMPPEKIYEKLTAGPAHGPSASLNEEQKRVIALFMSGRPLRSIDSGDVAHMTNRCASNPELADPASSPAWNGWGVDANNARFQSAKAAGLSATDVPRLKLKWAFGFPTGLSAFGQPSVVSGRVFAGSDNGYVYSLDARSGCVYWSFQAKGSIRNAISIGPVKRRGSTRYAAYFGDAHSNVYAVDARTGTQLWINRADDHFTARITAAPTVYEGRIYVPVSSSEEFTASTLDYPCCTFRGSVLALDANTGRRIWKTFVIPEPPKPTKKNSKGVQLWAPAGASVWNSPTVDPTRRALYFGTGDSETEPAPATSDAIMALDMDSGKVLWVHQAQANDTFLGGCGANQVRTENCPSVEGPDLDIGNSPILRALPDGRRLLIGSTKDGNIIALDPDRKGAVVWQTSIGTATPLNGVVWGGAADERNAYYGLSRGGMAAVQLATGEKLWFAPLNPPGARISNAAATTAIPGVAFVGGTDGKLHAVSTSDGRSLWEFDAGRKLDTVNGVAANGGSFGAPGPVVAGGMLFVGSGYGVVTGIPGNVLLAFSAE